MRTKQQNDPLRQVQLERDNYASQLTLVTKWYGEQRVLTGELARALHEANCWLVGATGQSPARRGAQCEVLGDVRHMIEAVLAKVDTRS